jgi:peptidoglycan/LPS O-acetylase OafA/YrhL
VTTFAARDRTPPAAAVVESRVRPPSSPRRFRPDIEGLRAIAVVSVVLYHAHLGVRGGYVGVDVFFVISGFLITRQLVGTVGARRPGSVREFYSRRIRRLLPAAVTVVVATVLATRIWGPPLQVRSVSVDALFTTFYGLNYRLAIEGTQYLHQGDAVSPLQHFWSLAAEEQFYVFWPLIMLAIAAAAGRRRIPVLAGALVVVIAYSYRTSIVTTAHNAPLAYFSLQTRAWELALGALVAVGASALARIPARLAELGAFIGLVAVVASCFVLSDATAYPGSLAAVPVGGAALVIACGTGARRRVERVLGEALMQCLGRVSYSWYLWHWPMLILAPDVIGHPLTVTDRLVVVWISLLTAIVSYLWIEDPVRKVNFAVPRFRTLPWFGIGGLMSGAVVAVCVLVIANPPSFVGSGADRHLTAAAVAAGTDPTAKAAFLADVKGAVSSSMATVAAPANLVPEPQHAGGDTPVPSRDGCHLDFLVIKQAACVFGDTHAKRTVVLFGDSHMEQWEPAFNLVGKKLHWRVVNWTKSACPSAEISVIAPTLNRPYTECDTWRARTIKRIAALHPAMVMVGESENAQGVTPITDQEWTDDTLKTLNAIKRGTHARVDFMGDNPVPRQPVPDCVAAHLDDVRPCITDLEHAYTYPSRHALVNASVVKAGYPVINPQPWVCSPTGCPPTVGNILVYRDPSHLSVEYVTYLSPLIASVLR